MTTPTERHLRIARETGYEGVEVRAERLLDAPAEVRAAAAVAEAGEVWSLNGVRIGLAADGRLERATLEADLGPRLAICRALGAGYLLAVPPRVAGLPAERAIDGVRTGLEIARDQAAAEGIGVAFEFLGFADSPIGDPAAAGAVVEGLAGVELVLDSCHWHASGGRPLDAFPVDRLAMVHLNDAPPKPPRELEDGDRLLPGEGVIELVRLVGELRARGYNGPWSLETFNPAHWAADPLDVAAGGRRALDDLLGRAA